MLLYLRRAGGFSVQEWERAIVATPDARVIQLNDTLVEVGDEQVWVSYGGPGAEVRLAYDPKVWVRSGDTHFWLTCFFYRDGYVYFELHHDQPQYPVRLAALRFAELLGAQIENAAGSVQAV